MHLFAFVRTHVLCRRALSMERAIRLCAMRLHSVDYPPDIMNVHSMRLFIYFSLFQHRQRSIAGAMHNSLCSHEYFTDFYRRQLARSARFRVLLFDRH